MWKRRTIPCSICYRHQKPETINVIVTLDSSIETANNATYIIVTSIHAVICVHSKCINRKKACAKSETEKSSERHHSHHTEHTHSVPPHADGDRLNFSLSATFSVSKLTDAIDWHDHHRRKHCWNQPYPKRIAGIHMLNRETQRTSDIAHALHSCRQRCTVCSVQVCRHTRRSFH